MSLKLKCYEVGFGQVVPRQINKYVVMKNAREFYKKFKPSELEEAKAFAAKHNSRVEPVWTF